MDTSHRFSRMPSSLTSWLLGAALVVSWLDIAPITLPFRAGLVWSALIVVVAAIVLLQRERRLLLTRFSLVEAAALLVACSALISALAAGAHLLSIAEAIRIGVVLLFFCLVRVSPDPAGVRMALGVGAVAVVGVNVCILLFGLLFYRSSGAFLFEQQFQEILGSLPRFKGFAAHPMALGGPFLPLVAMVSWPFIVPGRANPTLAIIAVVLAALVLISTLSFAAVSLLVALVSILLLRGWFRRVAILLSACGCLLVLWCDPVSLSWSGRTLFSHAPPPSYYLDGLGPQLMPVHSLQAGPLEIQFRNRGYFYLLTGAASCVQGQLLLGVGPRQFDEACDVMTMGTGGSWLSNRSAHTEYGALLAERGLLGLLTTLLLIAALIARRPRTGTLGSKDWLQLDEGLILAHLVAACAGPIWYQMGFAALVGAWSRKQS